MNVESLIDETLEPEIISWLRHQHNAISALSHIEELFTKLSGQHIFGELDEFVSVIGPVHIGAGSRIHSHVEINGPVIIGNDVIIATQSQIRDYAYIGSECIVGHSANIKRSICLNGAKMQDGTFVGDSVLGVGARVGSGANLAKQDRRCRDGDGVLQDSDGEFFGAILGKYVRLGENVVISPGTIVGEHSWVGSGCILHGHYPADVFITVKQELEIKPKDRAILYSGRGEYEHL